MAKKELPSSFMLRLDESKVPRKILEIMKKGHFRKQDCCVAFSLMRMHCYDGTWGNGSVRFLHCVCKMIDDGTPRKGTTFLSAQRAMKGWGTCNEDLFPSDIDLSQVEFEDWKRIPKEAWEDAKLKRIQINKALFASFPCAILKLKGREFRLFTHCVNAFREEDKQLELLVIDSDFETVAWASLCAYVKENQIILEDLFVKPEFRRAHHGTRLLHRIEQIACLEEPFNELNHQILVPISNPDVGSTRYSAVRDFFMTNGYLWKNTEPIRRSPDWSIFTATKNLDCAAIRNDYEIELLRSKMPQEKKDGKTLE